MGAVDFSDWAVPDLVITLGGKDYTVHPPSVEGSKHLLALVVESEIRIGIPGVPEMPRDLQAVLDQLAKDGVERGEVALGKDVYKQLVHDGHAPLTIDRVVVYAIHYWARGKKRADALAHALWDEPDGEDGEGEGPKA